MKYATSNTAAARKLSQDKASTKDFIHSRLSLWFHHHCLWLHENCSLRYWTWSWQQMQGSVLTSQQYPALFTILARKRQSRPLQTDIHGLMDGDIGDLLNSCLLINRCFHSSDFWPWHEILWKSTKSHVHPSLVSFPIESVDHRKAVKHMLSATRDRADNLERWKIRMSRNYTESHRSLETNG